MADESSTGSSNNMKKEKLPVKAIFNKTIETSSNFLTDIWKPRDQVDDQDDLKKSCPETDPPNKTHGKSGTKNCLAVTEEFDNGFDSDSDQNSLPFDYSCYEKEYYNDFDSLKSYKGTESQPHYCILAFTRPIKDDDGEGPSPSQVLRPAFGGRDTDDSTENSSESFYERRPVMAIMSYVGAEDSHSEMRAKDDTSGQKMGWQSLVRPSRPPPKPLRKSDTHPEVNQLRISFFLNGGGDSIKITSSVGTKVGVTPVTDSPETDKSTTDVKKTHSVTESGIKHHEIKPNQTVTETSRSVSTEDKTATDGIHTDLIQPQIFRQTGFPKQPNLSQSLLASNKHKTSHSEAEQHKLSLSVSFNSKNNQDSSLNPTSSSECDKKTLGLDQNELPGNKLESSTVQHDSSGGSLSSKLASRQSSHGSSFSPSRYKFEDEDDFDYPYGYVSACEEPIHKQKHSNDPFYQKEPSLYDDLEDSYSYSNYDTGLYPDNDDLHYDDHPQCNQPACHSSYSFEKNQHRLYHLANSERLEVHDVVPDGNCMFRAIVDQMRMQGEITMTCNQIRQMAVENLRKNPLQEDGTHMEDFFVAADGESWEQYLMRMSKDGEWGDQIILRGLSEVIHREICIISIIGDGHNQISIAPKEKQGKIYLGHVNDQHYYSLRPKGWNHIWYKEARKIRMLRNKEKEQRSLDNDVTSVESEQDLTPPCRNSKLINCNNQYYDEHSHVPVFHLTFIMENVIEKSNIITGKKGYVNMTHNDTLGSSFEFVGSVEEDLAVNLFAPNIQSLQGIGNEDFNAPKVSMYPNFYKIIDTQNVVFQHDSYEINSEIYVINSEDTNPGYTRLHTVPTKHHSHTYYRKINGTHCITTSQFISPKSKYSDMDKPPSYGTLSPFKKCQSIYCCYKCPRWPYQTREWISRNRPSGWPQKSLLKEVETLPCVLTPNSHPCSNEPDVEWMFDFSFPERFLLKENISKEQRYCFHVFKLLIDFHTGRMKELSTFVLKTIFLYTLEVLPQLQWDHCPSACVLYMIEILLESLKERKIPHYFLPENNIIEHLSGGLIYSLAEKVNAVREFPIMSIIFMAESHGVMSTYITDQIIEDLNHYSTQKSIQDAILHTFVPAYIKIISTSLALKKFRQSADAAVSGYKMLQDLFQGKERNNNPYEDMSLFMFIQHAMDNSMQLYHVWWLCFFIDYYKKTNTLSSFVHFKKISDMMDGFPPGDLDDISVPNHVLSYINSQKGQDVEFLLTMCQFLLSENELQQCAHYLRGLIQIVNKKIANPERFMPECQTRERMGYVMQSMITSLYNTLLWLLKALFMCYQKQQQTEYFQEYIEQLESVCDILASPSSYKHLAEIWQVLGNRKKMNEAIAKQRCLQG